MFYDQSKFDVRFDWGLSGARLVGCASDVLIIVDTLSFSTCVDVAVSQGAIIFPYRWKDERAQAYAEQLGAELAVPRRQSGRFSLSPESMLSADKGTKIVLPSPNGSEITTEVGSRGGIVTAGCFRNCQAVAKYAMARGESITIIACGERWPDGTLRPAVEDLAAAGAIIANLSGTLSPESLAAAAAWNQTKDDINGFLASCASGRELIESGFEKDVQLAGQVHVSEAVPILHESAYVCGGVQDADRYSMAPSAQQ